MAIHVTPIPITGLSHAQLTGVTANQHHVPTTQYSNAQAVAAIEAESSLALGGTLTLGGNMFAANNQINDIGAAGIDMTSVGLNAVGNGVYVTAKGGNTAVSHIGELDNIPLENDQSFTFTCQGYGGLFVVNNMTNTAGCTFLWSYGNATITKVGGDTGSFEVTNTDNNLIAIYKSASSELFTVKNYENAHRFVTVMVLGGVSATTAVG